MRHRACLLALLLTPAARAASTPPPLNGGGWLEIIQDQGVTFIPRVNAVPAGRPSAVAPAAPDESLLTVVLKSSAAIVLVDSPAFGQPYRVYVKVRIGDGYTDAHEIFNHPGTLEKPMPLAPLALAPLPIRVEPGSPVEIWSAGEGPTPSKGYLAAFTPERRCVGVVLWWGMTSAQALSECLSGPPAAQQPAPDLWDFSPRPRDANPPPPYPYNGNATQIRVGRDWVFQFGSTNPRPQ